MNDYTIVEPYVEFFEPPNDTNYLEFLERCTRVCYKSEEHIKLGSADKLMSKVIKEYKHLSVTEHCNAVFMFPNLSWKDMKRVQSTLRHGNPLIRTTVTANGWSAGNLFVSGNVRMWMDFLSSNPADKNTTRSLQTMLHKKYPFFFKPSEEAESPHIVDIIDENPITNKDKLSVQQLKDHTTLTFKLVGSRSMSHQLVRHRLFAFSQESMRYCNYGKKGFSFIVPPSVSELKVDAAVEIFAADACTQYQKYLWWIEQGLKPEDAREQMPICTKTEVVTTGTIGYWLDHVVPHRAENKKAQWQIRQLVGDARDIILERLPIFE